MLYGVKLNGEELLIAKKGFIVGTPPTLPTPLQRGVAGKEGGDFFKGGGVQFSHKNRLKSEIFNDKKSL